MKAGRFLRLLPFVFLPSMNYTDQIKHPKWQKRRLEILSRDNFTCQICGDTETELHIHHKDYKGKAWEAEESALTTTCKICHLILETIKREWKNCSIISINRLPSITSRIYCVQIVDNETERNGLIIYQHFNEQLIANVAINQNSMVELKSILNNNQNV